MISLHLLYFVLLYVVHMQLILLLLLSGVLVTCVFAASVFLPFSIRCDSFSVVCALTVSLK